jgi:soluble lytic murein transglycosylase-like protein
MRKGVSHVRYPSSILKYKALIEQASAKYDVDPKLIASVILVESGGYAQAYRPEPKLQTGSYGLMQILGTTALTPPISWQGTNLDQLYDPELNIDLGTKYLRTRLDKYGPELGIVAYNAGSPYRNGQLIKTNYLNKVQQIYQTL